MQTPPLSPLPVRARSPGSPLPRAKMVSSPRSPLLMRARSPRSPLQSPPPARVRSPTSTGRVRDDTPPMMLTRRVPNAVTERRRLRQEIEEAVEEGSWGSLNAVLAQDGSSPLHRAVRLGHLGAVKLLLTRSDPNEQDEAATALQVCADMVAGKVKQMQRFPQSSQLELIPPLPPLCSIRTPLSPGAAVDATAPTAPPGAFLDPVSVALLLAESDPMDLAAALLASGAAPESLLVKAAQLQDPAFGLLLLQHAADVEACDAYGRTPLWFAAQRCPALVQPLLAQGANPLRGFGGQLPVDVACGRAVQALRRETRWRELRLFVWAASQPVTDESPASLATLPRCICRSIATYLTRH